MRLGNETCPFEPRRGLPRSAPGNHRRRLTCRSSSLAPVSLDFYCGCARGGVCPRSQRDREPQRIPDLSGTHKSTTKSALAVSPGKSVFLRSLGRHFEDPKTERPVCLLFVHARGFGPVAMSVR